MTDEETKTDPTPEELAAMPLSQWQALEKADPGIVERVMGRFEAEQRQAADAPADARRAAEQAARAAGDTIAEDAHLTSIYIGAEGQRRADQEAHRDAEIARARSSAESFPIDPEGAR